MDRVRTALSRWLVALAMAPIRLYRVAISPLLPPSCRYFPTCSEYAIEAMSRHGAARGSLLALARLCRCHPLTEGGIDPVPEKFALLRRGTGRWPSALRAERPADTE